MTNKEKGKEGEELEWRNRGNWVDLLRGERKEVELRCLQPVKEIMKILESKGRYGEDKEYEQERRSSFVRGVSGQELFVMSRSICQGKNYLSDQELFVRSRTICQVKKYLSGQELFVRARTICNVKNYLSGQ